MNPDTQEPASGSLPPASGAGEPCLAQPEKWVEAYGDSLFRYALLRVRQQVVAEDLVQETFLAAWKARHRFEGRSSEKSWMFSILKKKLADYFRTRDARWGPLSFEGAPDPDANAFQESGLFMDCWIHERGPLHWSSPEAGLQREEFWQAFYDCLGRLPKPVADAFLLREIESCGTSQICDELSITANHLWVMLHRARQSLRRCLERNWFSPPAAKTIQSA